jgi:3-oxoacyl-[acyl-carrier-protein] synthase II
MTPRRVVVTGLGLMTPLGCDIDSFFGNLVSGRSGISRHPDPAVRHEVGWVKDELRTSFSKLQMLDLDRVSQLSLLAAQQAVAQAALKGPLGESTGVFFGTGAGGIETMERAYGGYFGVRDPNQKLLTVLSAMPHAPASHVALRHGVRGECQTYSTACSSSAVAIGEAFRRVRDGYLDRALAGGGESMITPAVLASWSDMRVLCGSPEGGEGTGCRPFSADRCGFALAEGAAFVVLESLEGACDRGARPLAELVAYGVSNDGSHISRPSSRGQVLAMRRALEMARISPERIGYINANGTATLAGDVVETHAIKEVFGDHAHQLAVSSTKSAHGHLIGAAGAVEFIATLLAVDRQVAPPTTHWHARDPECDLDYVPGKGRPLREVSHVMTNSFGFGGNNASLILRRLER